MFGDKVVELSELKKKIDALETAVVDLKARIVALRNETHKAIKEQHGLIVSDLAQNRKETGEFKKALIDSTRELLAEIELKHTAAIRREMARIETKAASLLKSELARTKSAEFKRYVAAEVSRLEKRLTVLNEVLRTKVASTELVQKKLDDAEKHLSDRIAAQVSKEIERFRTEIAKEKLVEIIKSVREELKGVMAERKNAQKTIADIINTIEELREDMDNMRQEVKQEIMSTARRLMDDEDSDIAAVIGQIGELKSTIKKLKKVSGSENSRGK
ncbi:MAG: hypothetical protein QW751_01130 [Candidatus Aenigmatarchaeota archaeon]|nr:hypothetical protein [Candidatus Aenigmarchaeota archaeon]